MANRISDLLVPAGELYAQAFARGLRPDIERTVNQWAEKYRVLPRGKSSEPGRYRLSRVPYLEEIGENLSPRSPVHTTIMQKGSQLGLTTLAENWIGAIIHGGLGPVMVTQPTVEMARRWSRQRIDPMIEEVAELAERMPAKRAREGGNLVLEKDFVGGVLYVTGANSAAGFRQISVRNLFLDDADGYPPDVGGEGSPLELANKRTDSFAAIMKRLIGSTPTTRNDSAIETLYEDTDKRLYFVACVHCGELQPIRYAYIKARRNEAGQVAGAFLLCEHCEQEIEEFHKPQIMAKANGAKWIPTQETDDPGTRGYHLSALYSPLGWYSWEKALRDHSKAKRRGGPYLKVFVNTVLAETYEETGEGVEPETLLNRCEQYAAEVPDPVLLLTCGVDVQDNRLELEVVGWAPGEESYSITYRILRGDPSQDDLWLELDELWQRDFEDSRGGKLKIAAACIDSGGHHTHRVYDYCREREFRRIYAAKGANVRGAAILERTQAKRTGRGRRPVDLYLLGVDAAKSLIYSRLRQVGEGAGACHFPIDHRYGLDYFKGLTAETLRTAYRKGFPVTAWHKIRNYNEPLDARVLAYGALHILDPDWPVLVKKQEQARAAREASADQVQEEQREREVRRRRQQDRGGGWVNRYRRRR